MAFSTLVFPFVFLPVSLILYFVLPKRLKNAALVVCSLVFFAWGTPEYLVLMVLDIAFHYFAGRELALQKARGRSGRFVLVSSVAVNLLLLGFFKYYGFLVDNLNALLGTALRARELPMPIGVSFFTFSLLSYLFDVYRDRAPAARNVLDFSLYVTFFPKLVSGPIVQYAEMEPPEPLFLTSVGAARGMRVCSSSALQKRSYWPIRSARRSMRSPPCR